MSFDAVCPIKINAENHLEDKNHGVLMETDKRKEDCLDWLTDIPTIRDLLI